jgi:hypothetical protein
MLPDTCRDAVTLQTQTFNKLTDVQSGNNIQEVKMTVSKAI